MTEPPIRSYGSGKFSCLVN